MIRSKKLFKHKEISHGFFDRMGGVSSGIYKSLNCGTGKFMRRRAFHNHLLDHKSSKLKRHLSTKAIVDERDADNVKLMIPYA